MVSPNEVVFGGKVISHVTKSLLVRIVLPTRVAAQGDSQGSAYLGYSYFMFASVPYPHPHGHTSLMIPRLRTHALWERKRAVLISSSTLSVSRTSALPPVQVNYSVQPAGHCGGNHGLHLPGDFIAAMCVALPFRSMLFIDSRRAHERGGVQARQSQLYHNNGLPAARAAAPAAHPASSGSSRVMTAPFRVCSPL